MYKLSQTIAAHNGIVRSLSFSGGALLTASSDKLAKLFELKGDQYQQMTVLSFFENYIYATCSMIGGGYAVGHDKDIYIIDEEGNPLGTLNGHDQQVCSLKSIDKNILISGSWDATAIVWDISQMKQLYRLVGHKYGVAVHGNSNLTFVTGSQDGILHLWNKNNQIKQIQAHNDIIREIQDLTIGYVTCSNDETIKIWTFELENVQTFLGHKSFIFTLKIFDDFIVSGGDDRQVILWSTGGEIKQTIPLPDTVWTVAVNQNKDLIVGTSDGKVRVFTTDQKRQASQEEIEALDQLSTLNNAQQVGGMSQDEINKLPDVKNLQVQKGKKEGEIRLFKNGNKPEAFMWSAGTQSWQLIGDVIGGKGQNIGKKQFPGDMYFEAGEYDHIFDVEDDTGASKLLPYNEGESFYQTAEKFCLREGYSKHYLQQVINFLKKNTRFGQQSSQPPESELEKMKKQFAEDVKKQKAQQQIEFKYIPFTQCAYYESKNLQGLSKKLFELNGQIVGDLQLTEKERLIFNKGLECLEVTVQGVNIENSVSLIFQNKLLKWELQNLLPIYDFFRIFCLHHSSEQLFSGLEKGMNLFLGILTLVNNKEANPVLVRVALQALCNCLKHNTNACAIMYHLNIVQEIILSLLSADEKIVPVIANLILNLSIGIYQRQGLNDQASRLLSEAVIQFLQFAERDVETIAKLITALGNLMRSPAQQVREQCKQLCSDYIQQLHIQTDEVATIKCLEEVKLSMQI